MAFIRELEKHQLSSGLLQSTKEEDRVSFRGGFYRALSTEQEGGRTRTYNRNFSTINQTYSGELQAESPRHWSRLPDVQGKQEEPEEETP